MSVIDKIKTRGYWRIRLMPTQYSRERYALHELEDAVASAEVAIRGWNYPHMKYGALIRGENYVGFEVDWQNHIESWRFYQSGQFIHYLGLWEDWLGDVRTLFGDQPYKESAPLMLEATMTVYTLTEIYIFAQRLAMKGFFESGLKMLIELNNCNGKQLGTLTPGRHFYKSYATQAPSITYERNYSQKEIMSEFKPLARQTLYYFFERFGFRRTGGETFVEKDQEAILQGRV